MPVSPDHEPLLRLLHSGASASALRRLLDTHGDAAAAVAAGRRDWASHGVDATACAAVLRPEAAALAGSGVRPEPAPCGSSRVSAGRLATSQCHQPDPVGASGS